MTVALVDADVVPVAVGPDVGQAANVTAGVAGVAVVEGGSVVAAVGPDLGAILVRSIGLATIIMFVGVGVPMWLLTGQVWDGLGLGAFCAFWGGPGFGLMAGGAYWTAKMERFNGHE